MSDECCAVEVPREQYVGNVVVSQLGKDVGRYAVVRVDEELVVNMSRRDSAVVGLPFVRGILVGDWVFVKEVVGGQYRLPVLRP